MPRLGILLFLFCAVNGLSQQTRTTVQSGNWSNKNTWDCDCVPDVGDSAVITPPYIVTFVSSNTIRSLTILAGGILSDNGLTNTITGHLHVDGIYSGTGAINLTGTLTTIGGTGSITNTANHTIIGSKIITENADLTKNDGNWILAANTTITNHGTFTIGGSVIGTHLTSVWINAAGSTLNIGGPNSNGSPVMGLGKLHAHESGNTVNYFRAGTQTIKLPEIQDGYPTYFNLIISGNNTKTIPDGGLAVNGDLTIESTLNGNGANKILYVRGNWINQSGFTEGAGTVVFDGDGDQYLTSATEERFHNLIINKADGRLYLNNDIIVGTQGDNLTTISTLTMLAGDIHTGSHKLILGKGTKTDEFYSGKLVWVSGNIIGEFQRWIYSSNYPPAPNLFPIGTQHDARTLLLTLDDVTPTDSCGRLSVRFHPDFPGNNGLPIAEDGVTVFNTFRDGYWALNSDGKINGVTYSVNFTGEGLAGFSITDETRLVTRSAIAEPWMLQGDHGSVVGVTVSRDNLTDLPSQFTFASETNCMPPDPAIAITGANSICRSTEGEVYSVVLTPGNTYSWIAEGGVFSPSGETTLSGIDLSSVTVDWGDTGRIGKISVVEQNSCTAGPEIVLPVTIHPLPPTYVQPVNPNTPQFGDPVTYTVSTDDLTSFQWTVTGDVVSTSDQGNPSYSVAWGVAGPATVCVTGEHAVCGVSAPACMDISVYTVVNSVRTGNWNINNTWDCNCRPSSSVNVQIMNTHTVTLNGTSHVNHLTIQSGGVLNVASRILNIHGDLSISGTLSGTNSNGVVNLMGAGFLNGFGSVSHVGAWNVDAIRTILPTTRLTKAGGIVTLGDDVVVTNFGDIRLFSSLRGATETSTWINASGSRLSVGDTLLAKGVLVAASNNNTVVYEGSVNQSIKIPYEEQYSNLILSGGGVKSLGENQHLNVRGNWTSDAAFEAGMASTVTFNGATSLSGTSEPTFHHLLMNTADSVSLDTDIRVRGDMMFLNGSFRPTTKTITLAGGQHQVLATNGNEAHDPDHESGGRNIYALRIDKPSGHVTLTSPLSLLNSLDILTPTQLNTNGHLLIRSRGNTTDKDGRIAHLPEGAFINGYVTIQRYLHPFGFAHNRYVSIPVVGATAQAQLRDDFRVTGNSVRYYDETVLGNTNAGYTTQPSTQPFEKGRGYLVWQFVSDHPVVMDVMGDVYQGSLEMPVSFTPSSFGMESDGWNLLGNPYPSAIRWSDEEEAWSFSEDISPVIYVTDMGSNVFRVFNYVDGTGDMEDGIIATGQAFWVKANAENPVVRIHEQAKDNSGFGTFYRRREERSTQLIISLENGSRVDRTFFKLNDNATHDFDLHYDAFKMFNENLNIFLKDDQNRAMVMLTLPALEYSEHIPIGIQVAEAGAYTLSLQVPEDFYEDVYLVGGGYQRLVPGAEIRAPFFIPESDLQRNDRFYLVRLTDEEYSISPVQYYPNPVTDYLTLELPDHQVYSARMVDNHGREYWKRELTGLVRLDMQDYAGGLYVLHLGSAGKEIRIKVIKQ
jgi:hypothetical protein